MKIALFLCFLGLISIGSSKHFKLISAFKDFVALAEEGELSQVEAILAEVEAELQEDYDIISQNYQNEKDAFNDSHQRYSEAKAESEEALVKWNKILSENQVIASQLSEAIKVSLNAINNAESQIDALNYQRAMDHEAFNNRQSALHKSIEAAQEALQLVYEVADKDIGLSFVQINNKKVAKVLDSMAHRLTKHNDGQLSTTMALLLVECTTEGINSELAGHLIDLIEKLIITLEEELDGAVHFEKEQVKLTREFVEGYEHIIVNESESANTNQILLENTEEVIRGVEETIHDLEYQLARNAAWWEEFREAHHRQCENYEKLLKRLARDLHDLDVAQEILEKEEKKHNH